MQHRSPRVLFCGSTFAWALWCPLSGLVPSFLGQVTVQFTGPELSCMWSATFSYEDSQSSRLVEGLQLSSGGEEWGEQLQGPPSPHPHHSEKSKMLW